MQVRDDGVTKSYSESPMDDPTRMGGTAPKPKKKRKPLNKLDNAKSQKLLLRLREWFDQEWERQAHNRYQMALDEDYYDSLQWTEEDAAELMERGQSPVVYNEIKPTIDWMIGTERRTRIDYKVLPRRKEADDDAEVKTKLMKYLSDVNKEPFARSKAFARACKGGMGWIETGIRGDATDEPIFYRSQSWRYMLYDSNSTELDLSDARYLFRWKYLDADVARAIFSDRKDIIQKSIQQGNHYGFNDEEDELWYMGARVTEPGFDYAGATAHRYRPYDGSAFAFNKRERVKVIECWYRMPVSKQRMAGGYFDGENYDKTNPEHVQEYKQGQCTLYDRMEMELRCALYTEAGLLFDGETPYAHNRFPFIPVWAYRRARDNAPYGPVRTMRDSQDSLNKRGSKALWILSSNRVVMDEGAVDDVEELRDEVSRPDSVIVKKSGRELTVDRDVQLADQHLKLMDRDQMYIRNGGGVTEENLGRETNANSGRAIIARQEQGSVLTTEIFDNLRMAVQLAGEIELSLIEQYYTDEKVVRLVGERGTASFVEINKEQEDGTILNDITANHADFIVSEQDFKDSLRVAMFESLFDIVSRLAQLSPEVALNLLDLVVEMADVPNRDELVARIRQISGQRDPESEPTPEELDAERKAKEKADLVEQIQIEKLQAELGEILAKGRSLDAKAVNDRLSALFASIQASELVAMNPAVAEIADDLAASAGFEDQTPQDDLATAPEAPIMPAEEQQELPLPAPESPFTGAREGIETPEID